MGLSQDQFFWDGYLHWAGILENSDTDTEQRDGTPFYEPIFVRFKSVLTKKQRNALKKLLAKKADADVGKMLKAADVDFLTCQKDALPALKFDALDLMIGIENAIVGDGAIECFLYREHAKTLEEHTAYDAFFEIIDVGPPTTLRQAVTDKICRTVTPKQDGMTFGAVIDNDIGFLNEAFCMTDATGKKTTRIESIWLQTHHGASGGSTSTDTSEIGQASFSGRELNKSDIDALLGNAPCVEAEVYRNLNSDLHLRSAFRGAPLKDTHGTAVAALAYGNDFFAADQKLLDVPLLCVQLPPEAAEDTSGTYSESSIVQGVRWLCWQARQLSENATLVINISYGALAGPKDGSKFIAEQIKREIESAAQLNLTVHVVYAFGNGLNNKQVAQVKVEPNQQATMPHWVIPRGQPLPSHMEIRAIAPQSGDALVHVPDHLEFTLTSPCGETLDFKRSDGVKVAPPFAKDKAATPARFYDVENREFSGDRMNSVGMVQLSIAPTVALGSQPDVPIAHNGDWTLTVRNPSCDAVDLVLQIQRGDTAPGFVNGGLQSQFEGAFRTDHSGIFPSLDVQSPLTNLGTNSAYTNAVHARIHTVEALQARLETIEPSDYSARSAVWTGARGSTDGKVVDTMFTKGRSVTGTYSGTRTMLSGTSAAAALKSRELIS